MLVMNKGTTLYRPTLALAESEEGDHPHGEEEAGRAPPPGEEPVGQSQAEPRPGTGGWETHLCDLSLGPPWQCLITQSTEAPKLRCALGSGQGQEDACLRAALRRRLAQPAPGHRPAVPDGAQKRHPQPGPGQSTRQASVQTT